MCLEVCYDIRRYDGRPVINWRQRHFRLSAHYQRAVLLVWKVR